MTKLEIKIGHYYRFIYPYYGRPDGFPQHTAHSYQIVEVIERLPDPETEHPEKMFRVRASDGWEGEVFESELRSIEK